jgi:hypothetical protein
MLVPVENRRDISMMPAEILDKVDLIFLVIRISRSTRARKSRFALKWTQTPLAHLRTYQTR